MSNWRTPVRGRRPAAFAGTFYPGEPDRCRAAAKQYVASATSAVAVDDAPVWRGAMVPHAGWICSAAIAAQSIAAIARSISAPPDVVVVFGAIHTPLPAELALLSSADVWEVPVGEMQVQTELRDTLLVQDGLFQIDDRFHDKEHAVEVELPLVQSAWPGAAVLPVEVPPTDIGVAIGNAVAAEAKKQNLSAVYLASSDLTHYGPDYRFAPAGVGLQGLAWAKDNDRRLLEAVLSLAPHDVVEQARQNRSACGPGAIAAMLAACMASGAGRGKLLCHANSYETLAEVYPQSPTDAVGYAALVVG